MLDAFFQVLLINLSAETVERIPEQQARMANGLKSPSLIKGIEVSDCNLPKTTF